MDCIKPPSHNHLTGYQKDRCRCDECTKIGQAYSREWNKKNRTKEQAAQYRKTAYDKRKLLLNKMKMEKGCAVCGYNGHPAALDFHHKDRDSKVLSIGQSIGYSIERVMAEVDKCEVLCANCHRISHAQRYEE